LQAHYHPSTKQATPAETKSSYHANSQSTSTCKYCGRKHEYNKTKCPSSWEGVQEMWKTQSFWKHVQIRSQDKTTSTIELLVVVCRMYSIYGF
jgi:hypothetical protein